jgi:hypothetical protein
MAATLKASHVYKGLGFVLVVMVLGLGAAQFYWLSELLAALLIFMFAFAALGLVVLLVFLSQQGILKGMTYFELIAARPWTHAPALVAQRQRHPRSRGDDYS